MPNRKQKFPIPPDAPETVILGNTLTYDPYEHRIRKPDGTVLLTFNGNSPSDLITWTECMFCDGLLMPEIADKLFDFAERCNDFCDVDYYRRPRRYIGKDYNKTRRFKENTNTGSRGFFGTSPAAVSSSSPGSAFEQSDAGESFSFRMSD